MRKYNGSNLAPDVMLQRTSNIALWFFYIFAMVNTPILQILGVGEIAFSITFIIQVLLLTFAFRLYYLLPMFVLLFFSQVSYYFYNAIFVLFSLILFNKGIKQNSTIFSKKLLNFNRIFFPITVLIGFIQWFIKDIWQKLIPFQRFGNFRGSLFQIEPSFVAYPLLIYIAFQFTLKIYDNNENFGDKIFYETMIVSILSVVVTKSISVLLILPLNFLLIRKISLKLLVIFIMLTLLFVVIIIFPFYNRWKLVIEQISIINKMSLTDFLVGASIALGSWRNIPDAIILSNINQFLLPNSPFHIREKKSLLGSQFGFSWLSTTFNLFSAAVVVFGVLVILIILAINLFLIFQKLMIVKLNRVPIIIYLLIVSFFFLPKGAVFSWYILGEVICLSIKKERNRI